MIQSVTMRKNNLASNQTFVVYSWSTVCTLKSRWGVCPSCRILFKRILFIFSSAKCQFGFCLLRNSITSVALLYYFPWTRIKHECEIFCVFFLTLRQIHDICLWLFKTLRIRGSSEKFTSSTQSSIWIWIISLWAISPFAFFRARNIADRKFYTFIAQVILVGDAVIRACMHQLQV